MKPKKKPTAAQLFNRVYKRQTEILDDLAWIKQEVCRSRGQFNQIVDMVNTVHDTIRSRT